MEITEIHRSLLIEELEQYTIVDLEPVPEPFLSLRKSRAAHRSSKNGQVCREASQKLAIIALVGDNLRSIQLRF